MVFLARAAFSHDKTAGSPRKSPRPLWRPETLEQYLSLFENAGPDQRVGENSPAYLMSDAGADANRGGSARRPHHRDSARARELPALLPSSVSAQSRRDGEGLREGDLARGRSAGGQAHSSPLIAAPRAPVFEPCEIRAAVAELRSRISPRADTGADLRGFPARQRGDRAQGPALPRGGRLAADRADRGQPLVQRPLATAQRDGALALSSAAARSRAA